MKSRMKTNPLIKGLAVILGSCALSAHSDAGIVIEFSEANGNVYATTSGSITRPLAAPMGTFGGNGDLAGNFRTLYHLPGTISMYSGGTYNDTNMNVGPTVATGDAFGFASTTLYLPSSLAAGEVYSPVTTFVWNNRTLAELNISSTPIVAFTIGGETVTYVAAVPEPSAMILLVGGISGACFLRRRK